MTCRPTLLRHAAAMALLSACAGAGSLAAAGDDVDKADKATAVPYETRQAPSHRVSLRDDRVFFLKKLEETDAGFVLHTMEDETIEVERAEVEEIVELEAE